jgi:hypothetical protein
MTALTTNNVNFTVNQPDGAIAARFEETHTFPTIPSSPLIRDFGIVFCGQLQSKFYITI